MVRDIHPLVQQYIRDVCARIKAVELHRDIREELAGHVEELADEMMAHSPEIEREDALRKAVQHMGDPAEAGARLNRIHRPKTDWSLVMLLGLIIGFSLVLMYSADRSQMALSHLYPFHLFEKKAIYWGLGLFMLLAIRWIDYRKLSRYSVPIFWGMIALMLVTCLTGLEVNGSRRYLDMFGLRLDIIALSPYVLIVALSGILVRHGTSMAWWKLWISYVLPPFFITLLAPDFISNLMYVAVAYLLFARIYVSRAVRIGIPIVHMLGLLGSIFLLRDNSYLQMRWSSYVDPYADSQGAGYMIVQSLSIIREAGWLGHGIGVQAASRLPGLHSDMLYPYLIAVFGWLGGIAVFLAAALLLQRIARAAKLVADPYGQTILTGFGAWLGMKFAWSMAMTLGWVPLMTIQLPLLGFGGVNTVAEMAALGLMMSIYRRKDMIRSAPPVPRRASR
ncbi:FtsW/RodA/SpoVE family cell cycle protein [Paenibacillus sp. HJGM_3]|uniref:FtsW/RodA/SpoVE family cell cycle protein n=1 Tax=Paenibacillus sp. HJGM_3 TaxID=3379816 RepID=UPI00385C230E